MSTSVYGISNYAGGVNYSINDIVRFTGAWNGMALSYNYLYCTEAHLSSLSTPSTTQFDGYTTIYGETKPKFLWVPSYNNSISERPKITSVQFGDGYESRMADGINNDLLTLELNFETRSLSEITAIIHFLRTRNATESFVFTPLQPYNLPKKFVCKEWRDSQSFYNNYNLSATFNEVVN